MSDLRKKYQINKERRNRHLKTMIEESIINVLAEQEMAQQVTPQAQPQAGTVESPPPVATPENQTPVPKQYTVDDMIDELNAIRGGRSFSDPEVYGKLVTFFKNISDDQRTNLDTMLTQIAELITGVDDAPADQQQSQAPAPVPPSPTGAPQQSAPMPGAQQAAGAAGVGAA
jgi:hypothetical protein